MNTENLRIRFGQHMKKLRLERGMTQEVFADKCGLHRTYIGPIERGEKNITLETANKITQGLGVSLSVFLAAIEDKN